MSKVIQSARDAAAFAMAGNSTLTVLSTRTGTRFTFRVRAPGDDSASQRRFVSLMTGTDNDSHFTYVGCVESCNTSPTFKLTKKSRFGADAPSVRAFGFLCSRVFANSTAPVPAGLEIRHEDRCGRCNRKLTTPESIDRGIGPECASVMGID